MIEYKRTITDEEQKCLEHDLLDITDWINKAVDGKISNCMKRAAIEYREMAKNNGIDMIPVKDMACAEALFCCKEYKNRVQREPILGDIYGDTAIKG